MKCEKFNIKSSINTYDIPCIMYKPENIKKIVIACHGFGSKKESNAIKQLAESVESYDVAVIALDFPTHGESKLTGTDFSVEKCINDLYDVESFIKEKYKNVKIGFFASSFGAYIALLKIVKSGNKYDFVILRCPALNMKDVFVNSLLECDFDEFIQNGGCELGFARKVTVTPEFYNELLQNDLYKLNSNINDIILIHGTLDNIVPITDSRRFRDMYKDTVKLYEIEGADHRFKGQGELEKVIEIATQYIK